MAIPDRDLGFIRQLVRDQGVILLDEGKEYLIESRLQALAESEGYPTIQSIVNQLRRERSGILRDKILEVMTIHETSFFRDGEVFETLRNKIFPEWRRRRGDGSSINVWCAACSTGQEAYSVAMLLSECLPLAWRSNVFHLATDISSRALDVARQGVFTQLQVERGLPTAYLHRYCVRSGQAWQVRDSLRRSILFERLDLSTPWPPLPKMDVVLLRNVLIYFTADARERILEKMRRVLNPDGYLILGMPDVIIGQQSGFQPHFDSPGFYCPRQLPSARSPYPPPGSNRR